MVANYYKIISFLFVLGLFLVPVSSAACSTTHKKIDATEKTDQRFSATFSKLEGSCQRGNCKEKCCHEEPNSCTHDNCNGNCNSTSCSVVGFSFLSNSPLLEAKNNLLFSALKKDGFYYLNSNYSFGYHPIWQPPKIG